MSELWGCSLRGALRACKTARGAAEYAHLMPDVIIRRMVEADAEPAASVFYDAVRFGAGKRYNEAQRKAWVPRRRY